MSINMDLTKNEGIVINQKGKQVAVYKDNDGKEYLLSAICPHMGCKVNWNGKDKTWDCPCHKSRFDKMGKVINGPANKDLPKVEIDK